MGALDTEFNQPSSSSSAAATSNISDLKVRTPQSSDKVHQHGSGAKSSSFSSSTSSPDSTSDDPFLEFDIEHDEATSTITAIPKRNEQPSGNDKKASIDPQIPKPPVTSEHHYSPMPSPGPGYVFESPPIQMKDRNNNSRYRIPSSVFARNKSTAPDWSMASNESLFSIQMGGMSFTQDNYNYFRSGELGVSGEPSTSGQKLGLSGELSTPDRKLDGNATDVVKSQELRIGSPSENAEDRKSNVEGRISHYSAESTSSTKSFAFPVVLVEKYRTTSYTPDKDVLLCESYSEISQDSVIRNDQSGDALWSRIEAKYNSSRPSAFAARNLKSLQERFTTIKKEVRFMLGCVAQVELLNPSGASNEDIMKRATLMMRNDPKYKKGFKFDHVFTLVRDILDVGNNNTGRNINFVSQEFDGSVLDSPNFSSPGVTFNVNLGDDKDGVSPSNMRAEGGKKSKNKRKIREEISRVVKVVEETNQRIGDKMVESNQNVIRIANDFSRLSQEKRDVKIMDKDLDTISISDPSRREWFRLK